MYFDDPKAPLLLRAHKTVQGKTKSHHPFICGPKPVKASWAPGASMLRFVFQITLWLVCLRSDRVVPHGLVSVVGVSFAGPPRAPIMGNPSACSCWTDEALNATLRTIGENTHKTTFYLRSFQSFRIIGALGLNKYLYGEADELPDSRPISSATHDGESVALASAILDQGDGAEGAASEIDG